jgi:hypothetical protein
MIISRIALFLCYPLDNRMLQKSLCHSEVLSARRISISRGGKADLESDGEVGANVPV